MSYMQNNLAFADGVQELSFDEIGFVGGGMIDAPADQPWLLAKKESDSFLGDLVGAIVTAVCDIATKDKQTVKCAVAGVVIARVVNNPAPPPGPAIFPY